MENSLSKLIEECGDSFQILNRYSINERNPDWPLDKPWHVCGKAELGYYMHFYGSTPEEAVSLLIENLKNSKNSNVHQPQR